MATSSRIGQEKHFLPRVLASRRCGSSNSRITPAADSHSKSASIRVVSSMITDRIRKWDIDLKGERIGKLL
uniref:Uncharacterized protein n=1 Tax=Vespula pensylvanica TaxID=30213 RepID=A0A834NSL0_VESPE|nr:hypothetical protein H0235_011823 [Vespula pensylvanica]